MEYPNVSPYIFVSNPPLNPSFSYWVILFSTLLEYNSSTALYAAEANPVTSLAFSFIKEILFDIPSVIASLPQDAAKIAALPAKVRRAPDKADIAKRLLANVSVILFPISNRFPRTGRIVSPKLIPNTCIDDVN